MVYETGRLSQKNILQFKNTLSHILKNVYYELIA
jgi:hypothetical protein